MKIYLIELRAGHTGVAAQYFNSLMLPILAVWAERLGWQATVRFPAFNKVDFDIECDVVALSLYTHLAPEGYEIARRFREMGKLVIIGGPHSKGCAEELKHHADLVFDRCNEAAWTDTLRAIENGELRAGGKSGQFINSDEMTDIPSYAEIAPYYGKGKIPLLLSSLGCPHDCDFCTDWDTKYVKRSVDDVIQDLQDMKSRFFIFCDPNFGANIKFTGELLKQMIPLQKKYMMETSLAWLAKDHYLQLLKDSGCIGLEVGIESLTTVYKKNVLNGSESILEETIKKIDKIKEYIPTIQINIVLGLDDDNEDTFKLVEELYRRSSADTIALFVATPFPGTPYYDRMKQEGRIIEHNWKYYNCYDLTTTMKNFELPDFCDQMIELYKRIHSPWLIAKKIFANFKQYRNFKIAAMLTAVLLTRLFNTWFFSIPDYVRAKRRTQAMLEHREVQV
ncbi:MAG: radical SAM protein [Gammaproteobacteria bacterium]|nr:radical SAM protein [Gammaproteobacteria bacterium]MDH5651011.1 radical SAM protein [Gammaproteobacteria bacterium]